jgi:WD40 repeat protein
MTKLCQNLKAASEADRKAYLLKIVKSLVKPEDRQSARRVLTDFCFLSFKITEVGVQSILDDFELINDDVLSPIYDALRFAAGVLTEDPSHLAAQLLARVGHTDSSVVQSLLMQARDDDRRTWLCPLNPTLKRFRSPLKRLVQLSTTPISALAFCEDSKTYIAGLHDGTLIVRQADGRGYPKYLEGHEDVVTDLAAWGDGKYALSSSKDGTVRLWDISLEREIHVLRGHRDHVNSVAVWADGARAITASSDATLKIWDLLKGEELVTLRDESATVYPDNYDPNNAFRPAIVPGEHAVTKVCVTDDWKKAFALSWAIKGWDLETGADLFSFREPAKHWSRILHLWGDGKYAATGTSEGQIVIWDLERCSEVKSLAGHAVQAIYSGGLPSSPDAFKTAINSLLTWADGDFAASASDDCTLKIWDLRAGEEMALLVEHRHPILSLAISPDRKYLLSGDAGGHLGIWNLEQTVEPKELLSNYLDHDLPLGEAHLHLRPHQRYQLNKEIGETLLLAYGHQRPELSVTDPEKRSAKVPVSQAEYQALMKKWELSKKFETLVMLFGHHAAPVTLVSASPDDDDFVSASSDGLKLWQSPSDIPYRTYMSLGEIRAALLVPGQNLIAAASDDIIKLWRTNFSPLSKLSLWLVSRVATWYYRAEADKEFYVAMKLRDALALHDMFGMATAGKLKGHASHVQALAASPDGRHLISGSADSTIKVWDLRSKKLIRTIHGHGSPVLAVAFTSDGRHLISASADATIGVWDWESGEIVRSLVELPSTVNCLGVLPGDQLVIFGDRAGGLWLWNMTDDNQIFELARTTDGATFNSIAIDPNRAYFVTTSGDGAILLWSLQNGERLASFKGDHPFTACSVLKVNGSIIAGDETGKVHLFSIKWGSPDTDNAL